METELNKEEFCLEQEKSGFTTAVIWGPLLLLLLVVVVVVVVVVIIVAVIVIDTLAAVYFNSLYNH